VETAGLLGKVAKDQQGEALQMLLQGLEGEPMRGKVAEALLRQDYLQPEEWRKKWAVQKPKLAKVMTLDEGFVMVDWEARGTYVQGYSGQPEHGYELAEMRLQTEDPNVVTWEMAARKVGAQIYVVAAPKHVDGYVRLVHMAAVRLMDADQEGVLFGKLRTVTTQGDGTTVERMRKKTQDGQTQDARPEEEAVDGLRMMRARDALARLWDALCDGPNASRTASRWEPLVKYLVDDAAQPMAKYLYMQWSGGRSQMEMRAADTKAGGAMRAVLMWGAACALAAGDDAAVEAAAV
jgi:hypothetical protein